MFKQISLLMALIALSASISLPLLVGQSRCMIVYTVGESQSVKIDIQFPSLAGQLQNEFYTVTVLNTETNEKKTENIISGSYKRELDLVQNVIYEVCMTLNSQRTLAETFVEYNSQNLFSIDHEVVKVPESLLKKEDFASTYQSTFRLAEILKLFVNMQKQRTTSADVSFVSTNAINKNLVTISAFEVFIVLAAGAYQFWALQNYLTTKQYI